jgi:hypothetical protein
MAERVLFRGFFSYAHDDAETDPGLISALTTGRAERGKGSRYDRYEYVAFIL